MPSTSKIFFSLGKLKRAGRQCKLRLLLGIFMALILPLSQAASFAHVIFDEHETHYHGHNHQSDFQHFETDDHDSHSPVDDNHQGEPACDSEHSSQHQHHTATDHLEFSKIRKPAPQFFNASLFVVLLARIETFCTIPQGVNWPRDDKQHWRSLSSGPPPQLRAPPAIS